MDVLVVGSGGREYELGRQLAASTEVTKVWFAPGNAGTAGIGENVAVGVLDQDAIVAAVKEHGIAAVVIGPEAPLVAGLADAVRAAGVPVLGPSRAAAELEGSKAFSAAFMERHNIARPQAWTARSLEEALGIIEGKAATSYVLKTDEPAGGKGVVLPETDAEARQTLEDMFSGTAFDGAGRGAVVIQERLHGPELSAFALCDGQNFVMLPFAQDHKRLRDGDEGPNTGGMGAYSPVPERIVSAAQAAKVREIVAATIAGMAADGVPYQGVLFVGLMLAEERGGDPVVIEYNVRFGDPEAEVVLPVLAAAGVDVGEVLLRTARGKLDGVSVPGQFTMAALTVCLAPSDYPSGSADVGAVIEGLDKKYEHVLVQQAGTVMKDGAVVTKGGRILYVTGLGATLDEAAERAYAAIGPDGVHFAGMQYRRDIGHQVRTAQV